MTRLGVRLARSRIREGVEGDGTSPPSTSPLRPFPVPHVPPGPFQMHTAQAVRDDRTRAGQSRSCLAPAPSAHRPLRRPLHQPPGRQGRQPDRDRLARHGWGHYPCHLRRPVHRNHEGRVPSRRLPPLARPDPVEQPFVLRLGQHGHTNRPVTSASQTRRAGAGTPPSSARLAVPRHQHEPNPFCRRLAHLGRPSAVARAYRGPVDGPAPAGLPRPSAVRRAAGRPDPSWQPQLHRLLRKPLRRSH